MCYYYYLLIYYDREFLCMYDNLLALTLLKYFIKEERFNILLCLHDMYDLYKFVLGMQNFFFK